MTEQLPILTTLPRSGTHWLKAMLSHCIGAPHVQLHYANPAELTQVVNSGPRGLIFGHFDYDIFSSCLRDGRSGPVVLLVRHPLDALISNFYKRWNDGLLPDPNRSVKNNLDAFLKGDFKSAELRAEVRSMALFSMDYRDYLRRFALYWLQSPGVVTVRYENLVAAPERSLSNLVRQVGLDVADSVIGDAARLYSFRRLSGGRVSGEMDSTSHYRRGIPGEWRTFFDLADIEMARKGIGDIVAALGYDLASC